MKPPKKLNLPGEAVSPGTPEISTKQALFCAQAIFTCVQAI
jgi:hypothetical protein